MRPSCVVPQEPVHERAVEGVEIVGQEVPIPRNKCLRECAIESLDFALHFGRTRIRVKMNDILRITEHLEVVGKLAAVVGLHMGELDRGNLLECFHEVRSSG